MKILVAVKRVPDTGVPIRIKQDKTGIETEGIPFVTNPYDEYAIEAALRIKEQEANGEVVILTLGEQNSIEIIRHALAMGADRGIHLQTDAILDPFQIANLLAGKIKDEKPDCIFMGKKSVDDDQAQVPAFLSEILQIPLVNGIVEIEYKDGKFIVQRETEYGLEIIEVEPPCCISFEKAKFEPRYPSLRGIMSAKKKPINTIEIKEMPPPLITVIGYEPPPERKLGKIIEKESLEESVRELVKLLKEDAKVL